MTTPNFPQLCTGLLSALEQFDEAILPLGLYASDELVPSERPSATFQEWPRALAPYLAEQGFKNVQNSQSRRNYLQEKYSYRTSFTIPDFGEVQLRVVKFSNIKVRQYGSAYHVDRHENRAARWREVDLAGHIGGLWKQRDAWSARSQARMLVFIGFDKAQRPLEQELTALRDQLKWPQKAVEYHTKTWPDKAGRGFGVRVAAWAKSDLE